jgi:hypothetical protein
MTWTEFLHTSPAGDALFGTSFLQRWGQQNWTPSSDDRVAAGKLHTQIVSRITTQRLGYLDGVEKTALDSIYALFEKTRIICNEHPLARHFETVAWHVLNTHVRPFTARWHRESERGRLNALDTTDTFRAELAQLQPLLQGFEDLLAHLRDDAPAPPRLQEAVNDRDVTIEEEMNRKLEWGISERAGGLDPMLAATINTKEREAIRLRRKHYSLPEDKPHAVALALSGGGIRSATFSLGVLVALARRGILPQVDYLSTVSGGGYLGAFLTAFLNSPTSKEKAGEPAIGLRADELPFRREQGEAEALRHIRHHSKYLASGSLWGRVKMMCAQIYGMLLNGLSIVFLVAVAVLIERFLRWAPWLNGMWAPITAAVALLLALVACISPRLLRANVKGQKVADTALATGASLLLVLLVWRGLEHCHRFVRTWAPGDFPIEKETLLAVSGAIPVLASAFPGLFGQLFKRGGIILVLLAAIAAPLFFFGVYLAIYHWAEADGIVLRGIALAPWAVLACLTAAFAVVYFWFLNINFTSPHRHYRNKLAEAYVIQPAAQPVAGQPFEEAVSLPLSKVGTVTQRGPYHLVNAALNVPGSKNPGMQGRLTDFFLFSPAFCGSPLTGYRETEEWEKADQHLDLATAMAISGAAAAPQMGLGTMRNLSFWLALLNIRLGYWVRDPNPGKQSPRILGDSPGLLFLIKEMLGTMDEKAPWLNISDGGHIENLGVYELLRRRCKYIVAVDGEQDQRMTFAALTTLQRLAAIDLGVKINISLDDLRLDEQGYSRSHFRLCRIEYPGRRYGYLLYIKLSLTGNEGEFLRRYRLDEPAFPHHSTADQFFTEAQFEAYRSLGEHVGDKLFLPAIVGDIDRIENGKVQTIEIEDWFRRIGRSLMEPLPNSLAESNTKPPSHDECITQTLSKS